MIKLINIKKVINITKTDDELIIILSEISWICYVYNLEFEQGLSLLFSNSYSNIMKIK